MGSVTRTAFRALGVLVLLATAACTSQNFTRTENETPPEFVCQTDCTESTLSKFGMVTDKVNCVFCHMNVYGDIASTDSNPFSLHYLSVGLIRGDVFANTNINQLNYTNESSPTPVSDPVHELKTNANYGDVKTDASLGFRVFENVNPPVSYPSFKADKLKAGAAGQIQMGGNTVSKVHSGNLTIDAESQTVKLAGEVFVDGDLVIYGKKFEGMGTLYVNGNIYIPNDIHVSGSKELFDSYRSNVTQADAAAAAAVRNGVSGLRLAARDYIVIGNPADGKNVRAMPAGSVLKNYYANTYQSWYTGETLTGRVPTETGSRNVSRTQLIDDFLSSQTADGYILAPRDQRLRVYNWSPNYNTLLKPEYELDQTVCGSNKKFRVSAGSVARIDATLYASKGIGGVIDAGGNILINGGVVTKNFNLLGATGYSLQSIGPTGRSADIAQTVHELQKNCGTVGSGSGTFLLNKDLINPQNGLPIRDTAITYDYRLRNGGGGFNLMRKEGY